MHLLMLTNLESRTVIRFSFLELFHEYRMCKIYFAQIFVEKLKLSNDLSNTMRMNFTIEKQLNKNRYYLLQK